MDLIQLSTRKLPDDPDPAVVFPYLSFDGGFKLALLVSDGNPALGELLTAIRFRRLEPQPDHLALPTGWAFHICEDDGPPEDEGLLAPFPGMNRTAVSNNVEFGFDPHGLPSEPSSIVVHQPDWDPALFQNNKPPFKYLTWGTRTGKFILEHGDLVPEIVLPLVQDSKLGVPFDGVSFRLVRAEAGDDLHWSGCVVLLNGYPVVGDLDDRLYCEGVALVTSDDGIALEVEPELGTTMSFGDSGLTKMAVVGSGWSVRHDAEGAAVFGFDSPTGGGVHLRLEISFPVLMPRPSYDPKALALRQTLYDAATAQVDPSPQLRFALEFHVEDSFDLSDSPIFTFDGTRWRLEENFLRGAGNWFVGFKNLERRAFQLPALQWSLASLLGEAKGPTSFSLTPRFDDEPGGKLEGSILTLPLGLSLEMCGTVVGFDLELQLDLETLRLASNRLGFKLPRGFEGMSSQVVDLGFAAIVLPSRDPDSAPEKAHDGWLDFDKQEFALTLTGDREPLLLVPGELDKSDWDSRVCFRLKSFDPDRDPKRADAGEAVTFRLNPKGLSLRADVDPKKEATVFGSRASEQALKIRPKPSRGGRTSRIEIVDCVIREASVFADMDVPGLDDVLAHVELSVRTTRRGAPPVIVAAVELESKDDATLAQFSAGYLQFAMSALKARLQWKEGWDLSVHADGSLSLGSRTTSTGGLDDLKEKNAVVVRDLDLLRIHKGPGDIELQLDRTVEFKCLDGMFLVALHDLKLRWGERFALECRHAQFRFEQKGSLEVDVKVGGVHLEFSDNDRVVMRNPSELDVDVRVGGSLHVRGSVKWVDDGRERYFAARGELETSGLPHAKVMVKIGTGRKDDGQVVPNVVFYGSAEREVPLFNGVVAKEFGAGIGVNNRLAVLGDQPDPDRMLGQLDRLDPSDYDQWEFVSRHGFYFSMIGTVVLAPTAGPKDVVHAYVAKLLVSVDVDLNVVAIGQLWLSSSLKFVNGAENSTRPALVGAIAMSPRRRLLEAALESRPNAAVEENDQLEQILKAGHIKLSFAMSPRFVDFYLEDVSYRADFLGVQMLYSGRLRFAVFEGVTLLLASQTVSGSLNRRLSEGNGGFRVDGALNVQVDLAGMLGGKGLAACGGICLTVKLSVSAWIKIEFRKTVGWGRWKKTIGWSKEFNLPETKLDLGLRGDIAMDESGSFGFSGSLSISVSICSYRLSISPSMSFNQGVIDGVRTRVSAFEARLDAARREAKSRSPAATLRTPVPPSPLHAAPGAGPMFLEQASREKWLLYRSGNFGLVVPEASSKWLVPGIKSPSDPSQPIEFDDHVTLLEVEANRLDQPVYRVTVRPPWDSESVEKLDGQQREDLGQSLDQLMMLLAETQLEDPGPRPAQTYDLKSDPRLRSASREYWTDEDRVRLPDHALPTRFREATDFLNSGAMSGDRYGELLEFLHWQRRAVRIERHYGSERSPEERSLQNRAAIVHEMTAVLAARGSGGPESVWSKELGDGSYLGMVFWLPADAYEVTVRVWRGETPVDLELVEPDVTEARGIARLLPARQELAIDRPADNPSTTTGERGRILVRLPIHVDSELLRAHLTAVSHWQIGRRFPWEDRMTVIGAYVHPPITYLDEGVALLGAYAFSDEFPVKERRLETPGLLSDVSEIEYALRMVPVGEAATADDRGWYSRVRVRLHVPLPDRFPSDLAIVLPARSLYEDDDPIFLLVSTSSSELLPAVVPDDAIRPAAPPECASTVAMRPLRATDFEIFAEPVPIAESGFYVCDEEDAILDAKRPAVVDEIGTAAPPLPEQSTTGKYRVDVEPADDAVESGRFRLSDPSQLPLEQGYRFFIRPLRELRDGDRIRQIGLLRPLPILLCRTTPRASWLEADRRFRWTAPLNPRPASHMEWIRPSDVDRVRSNPEVSEVDLLPVKMIDRPRGTDLRAHYGLTLDVTRAGGAEVLIRDVNDSAATDRMLCETVDPKVFQHRIRDFRSAPRWRLTPREKLLRADWVYTPPSAPIEAPADLHSYFVLLDESNPVLLDLERHGERLRSALEESRTDWRQLVGLSQDYLTALLSFERSPLNLGDRELRDAATRARWLLRWLVVGMHAGVGDSATDKLTAEHAEKRDALLESTLEGIERESFDQLPLANDDAESAQAAAWTAMDLDLAKQLARIVRRRRAVADEIFRAEDDEIPVPPESAGQDSHWLPDANRFETLRAHHGDTHRDELARCRRLLEFFPDAVQAKASESNVGRLLALNVSELLKLAQLDKDGRRDLAGTRVIRAAALTRCLNALQRAFEARGATLVRRPHHALVTSRDTEGMLQPEKTELVTLIPDDPDTETGSAGGPEPRRASQVVVYLNLLERMGFAVDIAGLDALNQRMPQSELLETVLPVIDRIRASSDVPHDFLVVAGREPDSEAGGDFPDGAGKARYFVGYSFLKVIALPVACREALADPTRAKEWLDYRSIDTTEAARLPDMLRQLAELADYIHSGADGSTVPVVRLEIRDRRWTSVPRHPDGFHADWVAPSCRGHDWQPFARRVSRYEPFVRWAENQQEPTVWPNKVLDRPGVPVVSLRRIIAKADTQDLPEDLTVSIHPDPEAVQFSYALPAAGARALCNEISRIRTGYSGCSLEFTAALIDSREEGKKWKDLLTALRFTTAGVEEPPAIVEPIVAPRRPPVRLFRNERLVRLDHVPFPFEYRLRASALYDVDFEERLKSRTSPDAERDLARRLPGLLACRRPRIAPVDDAGGWTITVPLTRLNDQLTPAELANAPRLQRLTAHVERDDGEPALPFEFEPHQLFDPAFRFSFYYRLTEKDAPDAVYVQLADLTLPWHQGFGKPSGGLAKPVFRSYDRQFVIGEGDGRPTINVAKSSPWLAFRIQLKFTIDTSGAGEWARTFASEHRSRLKFRASRESAATEALSLL
jgi:hypothetical protein